ncbi:MAG: AbrB/MazE/SpoVT family DNA-binding domain-containing protein [Betaproteobacteria bacterium]
MTTTRLSSKGQIVLPSALRTARRWTAGTCFAVEETADGVLLRPVKPFAPSTLKQVAGAAGYRGPARTVEDMDAAVVAEAQRRARRRR